MQRRVADAGVGPAVQSVVKHQNFKRMFIFGLRNLYELCKLPTIKWKENSLGALDMGVLPPLCSGIKKYSDDADVLEVGGVILFGITEAIRADDPDKKSIWIACKDAADALITILSGSQSTEAMESGLKALKNLDAMGIPIEADLYVPGIMKSMHAAKPPPPNMADLMISALAAVSKSPTGPDILASSLTSEGLVEYCINVGKVNAVVKPEALETISNALALLEKCVNKNTSADVMEKVIIVLESYKSTKSIQDGGSSCLAAMIGKDKVRTCIQAIKAPEGSAEKDNALVLLSSLSYISTYAGVLAKNKGIPMLCGAIRDGAAAGTTITPPAAKGVIGSCKMIGKIGAMADFAKDLNKNNALDCIQSVLTNLSHDNLCIAAACDGIAPMFRVEKTAQEFQKAGGFDTLRKLLTEKKESPTFVSSALSVYSSACHKSVVSQMNSKELYDILLTEILPLHGNNSVIMVEIYRILGMTADGLPTAAILSENPSFHALMTPLSGDNLLDANFGSSAAYFFHEISQVSDAHEAFAKNDEPVPTILRLLVSFSDTKSVRKMCLKSLDRLATEADVKSVLDKLQSTLGNAKNNPTNAFQALAGCNGLAYIERLTPIFHEKKAVNTIINGMKKWIEMTKFDDQWELIRMACSSLNRLVPTDAGHIDAHFTEVLGLSIIPQIKGLIDKQDQQKDHSLIHVLTLASSIAAHQRFDPKLLSSHVEEVLKTMNRFPDYRAPQQLCIEILDHMRGVEGGPDTLVESGAVRQVIATMTRIQMHENVQISGFKFLDNLLKIDPTYADAMRRAGGVNVCKTAHRIHGRKANVKTYLHPVHQALLPVDELEKEIVANCEQLRENLAKISSVDKKEPVVALIYASLENLTPLTVSEIGSKCAARSGGPSAFDQCAKLIADNSAALGDMFLPIMKELNQVMCNVAGNRIGSSSLVANNGVNNLLAMWETLRSMDESEDRNAALAANMIAQKRIMKFDGSSNELLYKKGQMPKIAIALGDFGDDSCTVAAAGIMSAFKNKEAFEDDKFIKVLEKMCKEIKDPTTDPARKGALVEAANELCLNPNALDAIAKNGNLAPALIAALDQNPSDEKLFRGAVETLSCLKMKNLRPQLKAGAKDSEIRPAINACVLALKTNKDTKPETLAKLCEVLNNLSSKDDLDDLKASGIMPILQELLDLHDSDALKKAAGDLMAKLGADDLVGKLIDEIILEVEKPIGLPSMRATARQCDQLQALLNTEIENPKSTLKHVPNMIKGFGVVIDSNNEAATPALASMVQVIRRVQEKTAIHEETSKLSGSKSPDCISMKKLIPEFVPALANGLVAMANCKRTPNKPFIIESLACLSTNLRRKDCAKQTIELLGKTNTVEAVKSLMASNSDDPEVCKACLEFLAAMGTYSKLGHPEVKKFGTDALVEESMLAMKRHRNTEGFSVAAINAIAATIDNKGKPPKALNANVLADIETIAADTPEGLAAMCQLQARIVGGFPEPEQCITMKRQINNWKKMNMNPDLSAEDKVLMAEAIVALAKGIPAGVALNAGVLDVILDSMDDPDLVSCIPAFLEILTKMAEESPETAIRLARDGIKAAVSPIALTSVMDDPLALTNYLKSVMPGEGNARAVCHTDGFKNMMKELEDLPKSEDFDEGLVDMLNADIASIKRMIEEDKPELLTLEMVNGKWSPLDLKSTTIDNGFIQKYLEYQINQTHDYSTDKIKNGTAPMAVELIFGCKNYQILLNRSVRQANQYHLNERGMPVTMINALHKHQAITELADEICCVGIAATVQDDNVELTTKKDNSIHQGRTWAEVPNSKNVIATCLRIGSNAGLPEPQLINRMKFLQYTAVERSHYNDTEALKAMVDVWDRYDKGEYTPEIIVNVMLVFRALINDHWRKEILEKKLTHRLVDFVKGYPDNPRCDLRAMPDALFCIGMMGPIDEFKVILFELGTIPEILRVVRRLEDDKLINDKVKSAPDNYIAPEHAFDLVTPLIHTSLYSRTVTNSCLILGQLTMGHLPSLKVFKDNGGIAQSITTMTMACGYEDEPKNDSKMDYMIVNGAGVIAANTSFKRDDMRVAYGNAGICKAVMRCIKLYDGENVYYKTRAIGSLLKSIGNLAMSPANSRRFVDGRLDLVLFDFFNNSKNMPDDLITTGLVTTSNMTMNNDEQYTVKMAVILKPLIKVVLEDGKTHRATPKMLEKTFEVIAYLCRQNPLADQAVQMGAITAILQVATQGDDAGMQEKAIYALGVIAQQKKHRKTLIDHKIFNFLTQVILDQANAEIISENTCKNALRTTRRCLDDKPAINAFCDTGGMNALISLTSRGEDAAYMTHMDAHRVLISCLANNPPPPSKAEATAKGGDDWDFDVADEGILAASAYIRRPASPRSWESCKLDPSLVSSFIQAVCQMLMTMGDNLVNLRMVRCAMGLLAYFACEKIDGTVDSFYSAEICEVLNNVLTSKLGDPDITLTACYIINNVAYASDPDSYYQLRKDSKEMRKGLKEAFQKMGKDHKEIQRFAEKTYSLLNLKSMDPNVWREHMQWDYPWHLTNYDADKYPNGVQDLPQDMIETIRTGDKVKILLREGAAEKKNTFWWEASGDLLMLKWRIDALDGQKTKSENISSFGRLSKDMAHSEYYKPQLDAGKKPSNSSALVLISPRPTEDSPNGRNFTLQFATKGQRDKFYDLLNEWREAAAYGL
eukprot:GHVH01000169.1.p1 GENE.GHVH01000169.1~~GHVH01000169.1.p1  ORF type:complete len:2681 (+),score=460.81 GHVH01000169.1:104-8146(+)